MDSEIYTKERKQNYQWEIEQMSYMKGLEERIQLSICSLLPGSGMYLSWNDKHESTDHEDQGFSPLLESAETKRLMSFQWAWDNTA